MNNDDDEFGDLCDYSLDYDKILRSKTFTSITKLLVAELKINPYKTVGQFMQSLSDYDVNTLLDKVENDDLEEILLLSEILSRAEGLTTKGIGDVTDNVNLLSILIAGESLTRKGITKSFYNNMSFGEDSSTKVVFQRAE